MIFDNFLVEALLFRGKESDLISDGNGAVGAGKIQACGGAGSNGAAGTGF
jgi:hypothetical protein